MAGTENLDSQETPLDPQASDDQEVGSDVASDAVDVEMPEAEKLQLDVTVEHRSTCERHICVAVSRDDVDRYFDKEFSELMPSAQIPGFRPGRAPRRLVESRFRKDVAERVKSGLLIDCLSQVTEEQGFSAISEPDVDIEAVEIPDEGPFAFEFNLEVRPEFDLPEWKGLEIEKPTRDFTDDDVERTLQRMLASRGTLAPHDGPAEAGDYVTVNLTFKYGDKVLSTASEEVIRIRPVLSFRDGKIDNFEELMVGIAAGETRTGEASLTDDAPNVALRGKVVTAEFEVLEVKRLEMPELDADLLDEMGGFECKADLLDTIKDHLKRQLDYDQRRRARDQITSALTVAADWDLPPGLLARQSQRELGRAVLELRRSGFGDDEILAHENELRQNSRVTTAKALKEHFILERIAEAEEIEATEEDFDAEIGLIAAQSSETPRRVRARLEKGGSMDVLQNQIVERMVIDLILADAVFTEVPYEIGLSDAEAIDQAAGGEEEPPTGDEAAGDEPDAGEVTADGPEADDEKADKE